MQSQEDPNGRRERADLAIQGQLRALRAPVMNSYKIDVGTDHRLMVGWCAIAHGSANRLQTRGDRPTAHKKHERKGLQTCAFFDTTKLTIQNWSFGGVFVRPFKKNDPTGSNETSSAEVTSWDRILGESVSSYLFGRSVESQQFSAWQRGREE